MQGMVLIFVSTRNMSISGILRAIDPNLVQSITARIFELVIERQGHLVSDVCNERLSCKMQPDLLSIKSTRRHFARVESGTIM